MALSQSALLEVLDALKASDSDRRDPLGAAGDLAAADRRGGDRVHRRRARMSAPMLRTTQRNGTRSKTITTAAGDLELAITKLRTGSFFPSLLERRRRIDQALFAVVMEAYVTGTSVRKVDDLVKALGADTGDLQVRGLPDLRRPRRARSPRSPTGTCPRPRSRTCSSTPPTARPGSVARRGRRQGLPGGRPRPSWSPPASARRPPRGPRLLPSATPRTARSGPRSCAR